MGNNTTTTTTCDGDGDDDDVFCEDFFIRILVWLPVISLLRFKSVCKSWRALIETPFFIDLHTTTTNTLKSSCSKFGSFILHTFERLGMSPVEMFMISSGGADSQMKYLGFPPCSEDSLINRNYIRMVGSCNGLICIHDNKLKNVTLWNPATRQSRILPKPITIQGNNEVFGRFLYDLVAFGFDVKTKDYKVVQFSCFRPPPSYYLVHGNSGDACFCRVQVYSLCTDSWRLFEGINYFPFTTWFYAHRNQGIYMNGCYFFVGKDESQVWKEEGKVLVCNNSLMYSFDFTKEILTTMQFPVHDSRHDLILSYLGDKMALFMIQGNLLLDGGSQFHDCGLDYEYFDIWVLKEQHTSSSGGSGVGVVNKESWTKLHSFRKLNILKYGTHPRFISNDGEFALISIINPDDRSRRLQLFNFVTKEVIQEFLVGNEVLRSDAYNESLVSIIGGNGAATTTADRLVGGAMCSTEAATTTTADMLVGGAMCSTAATATTTTTTADMLVGGAM